MKAPSSFLTGRMVTGVDPFYLKVWARLTLLLQKRRFSIYIHSYSASAVNT